MGENKTADPSGVEKILRVRPRWVPEPGFLTEKIVGLERLALLGEDEAVIDKLCEIVPTFRPVGGNGKKVGARSAARPSPLDG